MPKYIHKITREVVEAYPANAIDEQCNYLWEVYFDRRHESAGIFRLQITASELNTNYEPLEEGGQDE